MKGLGKRVDLHTHSLLSDGVILPSEIAARAQGLGYEAIAVTDHVDASNLDTVVKKTVETLSNFQKRFDTLLIPGVELTHVPPDRIKGLVKRARKLGAKLIIVHGETPMEPVAMNTNSAAAGCPDVDILAHPGILREGDAELAKENGVYIELSSRKGHCLTNGHVAKVALKVGAKQLVNSDMHDPAELLSQGMALTVALGSGLPKAEALKVIGSYPRDLIKRLGL